MAYDGDPDDYCGPWGPRIDRSHPLGFFRGCFLALPAGLVLWLVLGGYFWDLLSLIFPPPPPSN